MSRTPVDSMKEAPADVAPRPPAGEWSGRREPRETPGRPPSVTSFPLNCLALFPVLGALYWLHTRYGEIVDHEAERRFLAMSTRVLLAAVAVPIVILDVLVLRVHRRASTGLDWWRQESPRLERVLTKLLGLAVTVGLIALAYWTFPEYHGSFYDPLWGILYDYRWALVLTAILYFAMLDGVMRDPYDAYWQLGRVALLRPRDAKTFDVANHFRGWLVKAFFFPLMFVWLSGSVRSLVSFDFAGAAVDNVRVYDYLNTLVFGLDLLFTTAGYALSLRIIDTQIRTAEPTMYGWIVALFCYQPFYSLFERMYVPYGGGVDFAAWLHPYPTLKWIWAGAIVALISIYTLATVAFGVRFSNLTHRGILTGGPYRFTKHPAYITKNLSWWLVSVPFMHGPFLVGLQHCLALGCINMIYFLRARTEERHLSRDPDYVAYALWMNEHGVLAFLGRWVPLLRYRPPAAIPAPTSSADLPAAAE
ncbi:MAG: hypothetical protein JOZ69_11760 [Myxococcales bacterium]|nr:hypothetical protein [Myxococcales bacterium]